MPKIISWQQYLARSTSGTSYVRLGTRGQFLHHGKIRINWPGSEPREFALAGVTIFSLDRLPLDHRDVPLEQDLIMTVLVKSSTGGPENFQNRALPGPEVFQNRALQNRALPGPEVFQLIQILLQDPKLCLLPANIQRFTSRTAYQAAMN
jgi:hypothetical protein